MSTEPLTNHGSSGTIAGAASRFVSTRILRDAYLREGGSRSNLPAFVALGDALELAIVDATEPAIARAVSSALCRSLDDARETRGGYLPGAVVDRVQRQLVSPHAVAHGWGTRGYRFVLSRATPSPTVRELVASVLVAKDEDTIFFLTSRFNNLRASRLGEEVDLSLSADGDPAHRWFDKFLLPPLARFKPRRGHQIANFVVEREGCRGRGYSRRVIHGILAHYVARHATAPSHAQPMLDGSGFWQVGDPPWLSRMRALGFTLRRGAESFHVRVPWDTLAPRKGVDHASYNAAFGLPRRYLEPAVEPPAENDEFGEPIPERIKEIVETARSGSAKLQYIQLVYPFERFCR